MAFICTPAPGASFSKARQSLSISCSVPSLVQERYPRGKGPLWAVYTGADELRQLSTANSFDCNSQEVLCVQKENPCWAKGKSWPVSTVGFACRLPHLEPTRWRRRR